MYLTDNHNKLLEILNRDGGDLFALFVRVTLCQDAAEELMQELFLKLRLARNIDRVVNPIAYVRRIALNLAFDWRKSRPKHAALDGAEPPQSAEPSPLDELVRREELEEILDGIAKLRGHGREAFVMRHIQGNSNEDIAEQLQMTSHHVRALCHRAMVKLRKILRAGESMGLEY